MLYSKLLEAKLNVNWKLADGSLSTQTPCPPLLETAKDKGGSNVIKMIDMIHGRFVSVPFESMTKNLIYIQTFPSCCSCEAWCLVQIIGKYTNDNFYKSCQYHLIGSNSILEQNLGYRKRPFRQVWICLLTNSIEEKVIVLWQ